MNLKTAATLLIALSTAAAAGAQIKTSALKAKGFFVVPTPGTIPVDEKGQPLPLKRDSVFYIYVESANHKLQWERAWHGGRSFTLIATQTKGGKTEVGRAKGNGKKIEISPTNGAALVLLELADDEKATKAPQRLKQDGVLLQYRWNKKTYYVVVGPLMQLESPLYP